MSLLSDLDYFGTRLPRLPLAIERQFKVKLLQAERVEDRAKQHLGNKAAMEYFSEGGGSRPGLVRGRRQSRHMVRCGGGQGHSEGSGERGDARSSSISGDVSRVREHRGR